MFYVSVVCVCLYVSDVCMCMCMWCVCVCGVYVYVVCMCMWCVCVCGVYVYVVCMCMWCVCVCGGYVYVVCMCSVRLCMYVYVVCMCMWCVCACIYVHVLTTLLPVSILLCCTPQNADPDSRPLPVTQFHFTSWPDHGVPKFATSLISFIRRVQKSHNKDLGIPLLVHCSAGVGRTGTFILLDAMLERIRTEKDVNVYEFLSGLRKKRVLMVQTLVCFLFREHTEFPFSFLFSFSFAFVFFPFIFGNPLLPQPQYVFIHDALCELITCGETDIAAPALKVKLQRLAKVLPGKSVNGFQEQFQVRTCS